MNIYVVDSVSLFYSIRRLGGCTYLEDRGSAEGTKLGLSKIYTQYGISRVGRVMGRVRGGRVMGKE